MSEQTVTPELRQWIIDQAAAGQPSEAVLQSMLASGWTTEVAEAALEDVLSEFLADHAKKNNLPLPVIVPEPMQGAVTSTRWAGDREVAVLVTLRAPRLIVFGSLLPDDECDQLVALASARLERSQTVQTTTGDSEVNSARTSDGMFFERDETALISRVEARMAALLDWPIENGEGLQILRYRPGAEYKPHYDYFDPEQPGTPRILERGGQRVASLVCYLNTPARGGATIFPDVHLDVAPVKGNAVFFSYDRPHPMTRSLHGGAPVLEGEKWVATKWVRERRFE